MIKDITAGWNTTTTDVNENPDNWQKAVRIVYWYPAEAVGSLSRLGCYHSMPKEAIDMAKAVTLENLLWKILNLQPRAKNIIVNSAAKVGELLPEELIKKMPALENPNAPNVKSQISNILTGEAVKPYADCAEYLSDNLGTAFNHICGKWAEKIELSAEQARNLSDMLDKDENRDEISGELCTRLKNAFACRDVRALAALTLLAITRDTGNHSSNRWKNLSEQIVKQNLLPRIEEDTKQVIEICTDAYKMFDAADAKQFKDKLAEAKKFLAQIHQDADPLEKGEVFAALGRIFFKKFNGFFPPVNCRYLNEHIAALYDEGILTADSLAKESLAKLAPINPKIEGLTDASKIWHELSALLRLATAFNFLRTAQDCFEAASAPERWHEVSEDYLENLRDQRRKGSTRFLSEFKTRAAETSAEKKSWYGDAFFRLAKDFQAAKDTDNFISCLKCAGDLDNEDAHCLIMTTSFSEEKPPNWPWNEEYTYELAEKLTVAQKPINRGAAYYTLYKKETDSNKKNQLLKMAYKCGYPQAVKEYQSEPDKSERVEFEGAGDCLCNVAEDNPFFANFLRTDPQNLAMHYRPNRYFKDVVANVNERLTILLVDDAEKNLVDFFELLRLLKGKDAKTTVTIFLRGETRLLMPLLDTALNNWYDDAAESRPLLRVQIIDEHLNAAQELLVRHPIFIPIRAAKIPKKILRFVVIGGGELALNLVRTAFSLLVFAENSGLTAKITVLSPYGRSLKDELQTTCPGIVNDKMFDKEHHVFFPSFPAPDVPTEKKKFLTDIIKDFVAANEALYFVVAASDSALQNMSVAINVRELLIRAWLEKSSETEPPITPVAFYCPIAEFATVSKNTVVLGDEYRDTPHWPNSYALIPFAARNSWQDLISNPFERMSLAVHMVYCGAKTENDFKDCYPSYAKRTYNQQQSFAVVLDLPYRLWAIENLFGKDIFGEWDISDADFFPARLRKFAEATEFLKDDSEDEKLVALFSREHSRWINSMKADGWAEASNENVRHFVDGGNRKQQLFLGRVHPCLRNWRFLDSLSEYVTELLNLWTKKKYDFKKYDKISVRETHTVLNETLLKASETFAKLFCPLP